MRFVSQEAPSVHRLQDFVYSLDVQATLSRAYSDEGCACCEWHWGPTIPAIVYFQWPRLACDALSFPDSPSSEQGWGVKVGVNRRDLHVWPLHVIVFELLTTQSVCKRAWHCWLETVYSKMWTNLLVPLQLIETMFHFSWKMVQLKAVIEYIPVLSLGCNRVQLSKQMLLYGLFEGKNTQL